MIENYFYLIWAVCFFIIYLVLFILRKDVRREMIFVGLLFGFAGLASEYIHIKDWWAPVTITGTPLGIEDFLIGLAIGGVAAVLYEEVYKKRIRKSKKAHFYTKLCLTILSAAGIFYINFYLFHLHSFYSAVLTFVVPTLVLLIMRRDLIKDSFMSGLFLWAIGVLFYLSLYLILPDFFNRFWYLPDEWFSTFILGIPLAEHIWYFLAGMFIGPLYEFWQEGRLVKSKK